MKKNTEIYTEKFVVIYRDEIKISKEEQEKKELNRSTLLKILQKITKANSVFYENTGFKFDYIEYKGFYASKFLEQSKNEFNIDRYVSISLPISPEFSICIVQKPHVFSMWENKKRVDHKDFKNRNLLIEKKDNPNLNNKKTHLSTSLNRDFDENSIKTREIKLEIEKNKNIGAIAIIDFIIEKD